MTCCLCRESHDPTRVILGPLVLGADNGLIEEVWSPLHQMLGTWVPPLPLWLRSPRYTWMECAYYNVSSEGVLSLCGPSSLGV